MLNRGIRQSALKYVLLSACFLGCACYGEERPGGTEAELVARLDEPTIEWQIGELLGSPETTFGVITDAVLQPGGSLVILDNSENMLTWVDGEGAVRSQSHGRNRVGEPLIRPRNLHLEPTGDVHVVDYELGEIRSYGIDSGEFQGWVPVPRRVTSICRMTGRWYLLIPTSVRAVRVLDDQGREIRSWSLPIHHNSSSQAPPGPSPWQDGWLTCDEASDGVIFASRLTPMIMALSSQGELRWTSDLQPFREILWEVQANRLIPSEQNAGLFDQVTYATMIDGELAVTVSRASVVPPGAARPNQPAQGYTLHLFNPSDGTYVERLSSAGNVFAAHEGYLYAFINEGVPQVKKWEIGQRNQSDQEERTSGSR
jgi:hypothetical protein